MSNKKINIALVDDHALFRSGIATLLKELEGLHVTFQAANAKEMQALLPKHTDTMVILMDINMPGIDGYAATEWVKEHFPEIHVLALSMFDDDMAIIRMLKCGAGGYILKEAQPTELYKAITVINECGLYSSEMIAAKLINSLRNKDAEAVTTLDYAGEAKLTDKDIEFIKCCASELTYKEISDKMFLASRSVDNYRVAVFEKLGVKSRVGVVMYAYNAGLIIPDYKNRLKK